jgi:hypothetical protein
LIIRRVAVSIFLSICSIGLRADTVTLPAAASVQGLALFISDVRVFNTSYMASVAVTATYRFGSQPVKAFNLAPRESKSFDDICVSLFAMPNSLGAVEFTSSAPAGTIVVTSRLYSPFPTGGAVGMFIPGLPSSAAQPATVLPGLMNGASRTNVGVYNPNDASVNVAVRLYDGPVLLGTVPLTLGPRTGTQISNIYKSLGYDTLVRTDGVCTVDSGGASPLFSYAAMADNATQDTILVVGAPDVAAPAGYNPPSPTPTGGSGGPTPTPTPTPTGPSPTPTPTPTPTPGGTQTITINVRTWDFSPGGPVSASLILQVGTTYRLVFHDVDSASTLNPMHGFSGISDLGLPAGDCARGGPDFVISSFTPQAFQRGNWPFKCTQEQPPCGGDAEMHQGMIGLIIIQ